MKREAEAAVRHIHEEAKRLRDEAEAMKVTTLAEAAEGAEQIKREAKADAREILMEAHDAARRVTYEGSQLSGHLNELSVSLRKNAERLLNDVKLAHTRLTDDLDVGSGTTPPPRSTERVSARRRAAADDEPPRAPRTALPPSRASRPSTAAGRAADPGPEPRRAREPEPEGSPPMSARERRRLAAARGEMPPIDPPDSDFDVPEFIPGRR